MIDYHKYYEFENGYGASVIQNQYSYGGDKGLYEIAVLKGDDICFDTPITSDVVGHCTLEKVADILNQIKNLQRIIK